MCGNSRDRGDSRKSSSDHGSTWSAIFKKGKGKVDRPQLGLNATVEGPSRVSSARPIDDINLHGPRADPNVAPIPAPLSDNVSQTTKLRDAIERLNAAVKLLHKVIAMFDTTTDPDADLRRTQLSLPESNKTLDKSIKDIDVIVSLLIDKTQTPGRSEDTLAKLGYAVEDLCRAITPFLKNVLAVTIPASAVFTLSDVPSCSLVDSDSESIWRPMHRNFPIHTGASLIKVMANVASYWKRIVVENLL